jgi:predicted DNA-binding protein (MmcQ/YjbR family)
MADLARALVILRVRNFLVCGDVRVVLIGEQAMESRIGLPRTALPHYTRLMDNERIREICLALPHARETLNWGQVLVYWVGDREIGGKSFAMTNVDNAGDVVLSLRCGAERFHELLEMDGIRPAPYSANSHWVALERWDALKPREIAEELARAHALIYEKLPKRVKAVLALPEKERAKLILERKKLLAARK